MYLCAHLVFTSALTLSRCCGLWLCSETTVLLEEPEAFVAEMISEDEKAAKTEAERTRPGLTMFTDGSRLENGKVGYAVVWQNGRSWMGVKNHKGNNQEAYAAECAALARALGEAT